MKTVLTLVSVLLVSGAVSANEGPCKNDIETLCKDVKGGKGRMMKCLRENSAKLSPECKAHGEQMKNVLKEHKAELREACKGDVESLCAEAGVGPRAKAKCLRENKDKLSAACKAEVEKTKQDLHEAHKNSH